MQEGNNGVNLSTVNYTCEKNCLKSELFRQRYQVILAQQSDSLTVVILAHDMKKMMKSRSLSSGVPTMEKSHRDSVDWKKRT